MVFEIHRKKGMLKMSKINLPAPVAAIYKAVAELEAMYPGRKFTPDGHLVGSIGEVIAQETFGLKLLPMSAPSHDAICKDRGKVQIKITAGKSVAFRHECEHLIVLRIISPQEALVEYDGPGKPVWENSDQYRQTASDKSDWRNYAN